MIASLARTLLTMPHTPLATRKGYALLIGLLWLLLAGCQPPSTSAPPPPVVLTQPLGTTQSQQLWRLAGEVRARHEFDLSFRIGGKIQRRMAEVGQSVRPGDALAQIDPQDIELALASAQAQRQASEVDHQQAQAELKRYQALLEKKFVSPAAYDQKVLLAEAAHARLQQAKAQANLTAHQRQYSTLTSDSPALITAILAEAGQVVSAGQPVLRLALPGDKEVSIALPEQQQPYLKTGQAVDIHFPSFPSHPGKGVVREISPLADANTRTFPVRVRLTDAPPALTLGMTAEVRLTAPALRGTAIPRQALSHAGETPRIWIVREQQAQAVPVRLIRFDEQHAFIDTDLPADTELIVSGTQQLTEHLSVRTRPKPLPAQQR